LALATRRCADATKLVKLTKFNQKWHVLKYTLHAKTHTIIMMMIFKIEGPLQWAKIIIMMMRAGCVYVG